MRALAREHGLSDEELGACIIRGECGRASERLLPTLRGDMKLPPEFAISFVSGLAGVLLAAEFLKDHFAQDTVLDSERVRAVFQFATPLARTNRAAPYPPDASCPLCGPRANELALDKWRERAQAISPQCPAA